MRPEPPIRAPLIKSFPIPARGLSLCQPRSFRCELAERCVPAQVLDCVGLLSRWLNSEDARSFSGIPWRTNAPPRGPFATNGFVLRSTCRHARPQSSQRFNSAGKPDPIAAVHGSHHFGAGGFPHGQQDRTFRLRGQSQGTEGRDPGASWQRQGQRSRTTSPKIPSEPLRLVVRVGMKVTSATKNRTAQYPFDLASGEKRPPRLRLFAPPLPGGAAIGEAGELRSHLSLPPGCGNRRLASEGIIERSLAVVTLIFATAAPGRIVPAPALSILLVRSGPSLEPL